MRQKLILDRRQLGQVLGLPDGVEVVGVSREPATSDRLGGPVTVHVVLEGPELPDGWRLPVRGSEGSGG